MRQFSTWVRGAIIVLVAALPKNGHAATDNDPAPTGFSASLVCNTINADGRAVPYHMEFSSSNSTILVRDASKTSPQRLATSQVNYGDRSITFTLKVENRVLNMKVWGGFYRPHSLVDGRDVSGASEGLPFLVGVCDESEKVSPVIHEFRDERYPTIDGKKVQNCFSVTLDGRYFSSIEISSTQNSSSFSTAGPSGAPHYSRVPLKMDGFPPLPKREGFFSGWRSYSPSGDAKGPRFVSEFEVNLKTMLAAEIWDFQSLDDDSAPLMVGRGHCGFFPVEAGDG